MEQKTVDQERSVTVKLHTALDIVGALAIVEEHIPEVGTALEDFLYAVNKCLIKEKPATVIVKKPVIKTEAVSKKAEYMRARRAKEKEATETKKD